MVRSARLRLPGAGAASGTGSPACASLDAPDVDPAEEVTAEWSVITATSPDGASTTYQVPVVYRSRPDSRLAHALIGQLDDGGGRRLWVYDAPHDPFFVRAWLRLMAQNGKVCSPGGPALLRGIGRGRRETVEAPSRVLCGEQSNTSVIVDGEGPSPVIVKLFRVLHPGSNPDVVVQSRLAEAGCDRVPRPVGWVEGRWLDPADQAVDGHLAYACEFLPGSQDAWREACMAVSTGSSFAEQSHQLGQATAQVHATLAQVMPTRQVTPRLLGKLADGLTERIDWAVEAAPALGEFAPQARPLVDAVRHLRRAPRLQQIHGDYHLGQVLHHGDRGWVLLDFEGEPLRPLVDRVQPDFPLRDIAGMLRSFDYAARHSMIDLDDADPRALAAARWVHSCREAFLTGYASVTGHDPRSDVELLRALELDKALYEVAYETRNRPGWVQVPLAAVRRLLGADGPVIPTVGAGARPGATAVVAPEPDVAQG
ncbi:MAG: maltokinase [Actinomycetota bacterium]|nr:maltokinase [Actinomycetota bacterium]